MSRPVPAATSALRVLRFLSTQAAPVPAARVADAVELPRSSAYHLLSAMEREGFVTHYADDRLWGIGLAAYEVGVGYSRQEPLARLARMPIARLVDTVGQSAHLAILHGREVVYVLEERAPGKPPLVTDVGVRLPAALTASGRAILATLSASQVRALFPDRSAFVERHGRGPTTPTALRHLLTDTRIRGHATEDGEVTPGFASVAVAIDSPPGAATFASVAVTYDSERDTPEPAELSAAVREAAAAIATRLRGASARTLGPR
ncbi:IclR family transcriptional regulator [Solicola gregarius]|uniref:IclR family transcriptional regulator n=1 Tax=Solicola gregarius TaxID=2908642 RepID=A0AA46TLF3_9ACTN|nr:IclR family transcriptional regulator [Solicola gregarius]UYM07082.1 IclR family transcriptional regulator [Solicola gregarius]